MTYNLTKRLNEQASFSEKKKVVDGFTFDLENERSVIKSSKLGGDSVGSTAIADNSVSTAAIQGSAVTNTKLASSSVDSRVIANGAVGSTEILGNEIQGTHITGGAIVGTHITSFSYASGTGGIGTMNAAIFGTPTITGGAVNNAAVGTPTMVGGTATSLTLGSVNSLAGTYPGARMTGTPIFDVNSGSAALGADGAFALQTFGTAGIIAIRVGGTTFYLNPDGTI